MSRARFRLSIALLASAANLTIAASSQAAFHQWKFTEFFSNASGSVQFIEMQEPQDFEDQTAGVTIHSTSTGKTFTFPSNLSTFETGGQHLLITTPGFGSLPGAVAPDFATLPTQFFNPAGDTLIFAGGFDSRNFASVPINGTQSRNYPSNTLDTNSPTNLAGDIGSVNLSPEPTTLALAILAALSLVHRRKRCPTA